MSRDKSRSAALGQIFTAGKCQVYLDLYLLARRLVPLTASEQRRGVVDDIRELGFQKETIAVFTRPRAQ